MNTPHAGRWMVAAVLATYGAIFACAIAVGWGRTWSVLTVDSMGAPFGDLRAITGATVTIDRGLDPMTDNIGDPWHRPANYPRVWMTTAHALRLTPETTFAYGLVLFGFFIAALALLAPVVESAHDAIVMYLGAISPAALLSVERGKIEFVILALVCAVTIVRAPVTRAALLTAATLLKIFPAFALAAVTLTSRRARRAGLVGLGIAGAWAYVARSDLRIITASMPVDSRGAYGLSSLAAGIWHVLAGDRRVSWAIAGVLVAAAVIGGAWAALRAASGPARNAVNAVASGAADGLVLAASIYVGSFFAGSNYDYRLIFLLPALPFFSALRRTPGALSRGATAAILAILLAMSDSPLARAFGHAGTAINDLAKVAVLGLLIWASVLHIRCTAGDARTS